MVSICYIRIKKELNTVAIHGVCTNILIEVGHMLLITSNDIFWPLHKHKLLNTR